MTAFTDEELRRMAKNYRRPKLAGVCAELLEARRLLERAQKSLAYWHAAADCVPDDDAKLYNDIAAMRGEKHE